MSNELTAWSLQFESKRASIRIKLNKAFSRVQIEPSPQSIERLLTWGWHIDDSLRHQDPRSRELTEAVATAASQLLSALSEAREYSSLDCPSGLDDDGAKVNTCDHIFEYEKNAEHVWWHIWALAVNAHEASRRGHVPQGRGQPPLLAYSKFIGDLHSVYSEAAGSRGYYAKDGRAHGPFVEVVWHAQEILPEAMRLRVRDMVGSRVLAALRGEKKMVPSG